MPFPCLGLHVQSWRTCGKLRIDMVRACLELLTTNLVECTAMLNVSIYLG